MEEWKEYRLREVCDLIPGFAFKSGDFGNYITKVIKIKDINPPFVDTEGADGVNLKKYDANRLSKYIVKKDDFILAMTGATIGKIGRYVNDTQAYLNQRVLKFLPKENFDSNYIYYCLITRIFKLYVINHIDSESAQPNISANTIGNYPLLLPSLKTQIKISSILKSLDDKIENNRKINENLEQQAQALFKSWFIDFEPFKDGKFIDSKLGPIPEGWRVGTLDEICCFISRGISPKYDETTEEFVLGQTCVRNNIVTLNNARKHRPKVKNEKWTRQWDVLINSTGVGSLGRVGIVYFDKANVAFDSHLTVVRTKENITRLYVGRNLLNRQLEIENMAVGSTGQTELPRDSVKSMPIIIPTHFVFKKFNELIKPMALQMYHLINENISLSQTRDTVLPKLMSGEIEV